MNTVNDIFLGCTLNKELNFKFKTLADDDLGLTVGQGSRFWVCSLVFMTSRGVVNAAATAPAIEPASKDVVADICPSGLITLRALSFTATMTLPYGRFIANVVGRDT